MLSQRQAAVWCETASTTAVGKSSSSSSVGQHVTQDLWRVRHTSWQGHLAACQKVDQAVEPSPSQQLASLVVAGC